MKSRYVVGILALIVWAAPVMAQTTPSASNMDLLREKVKADKKLLVADNMDLTDTESKQFWPLYDEYQRELEEINNKLGRTILEYAEASQRGPLSNDTAKKLMADYLSVEQADVKLKRTYADKIGKVLPAPKMARYLQIENKIRAVIKAELAQHVPLVY